MSSITDRLFRPCPWPAALALAFAIGAAHVLAMLPVGLILGTSGFWAFPHGIVPGSLVDMSQVLMGYRYLAQAPWMLPLLHVPAIIPPAGTNAFWLDPVPWLGLLARPVSALAGGTVNLLGVYLFLVLVLPGVALAAVLRAAGERGLAAAAAAALLADAMPSLLIEWGHAALSAQALVTVGLALYVMCRHDGHQRPWRWLGLLALLLLTNLYLFVMAGGIWAAGLAQAALDRAAPRGRLAAQAGLTLAALVALGLLAGILSRDVGSSGSSGFGTMSANLGSFFVPQMSGALPPLRGYWMGMHSQVLAYPGLGALLVLAAAALVWVRRPGLLGALLRRHAALAALLAGYGLFALSNRVTLGAHVLLEVPLPERLVHALGAFRASGRFVWPVTAAVLAAALLVLLRRRQHGAVLALLAVAGVLQLVDAGPLRAEIAASAAGPLPALFDRARAASLLDGAQALMVFPSHGCIAPAIAALPEPAQTAEQWRLGQANAELQLLGSQRNLPLNTVLNARLPTDCAAEATARQAPLRPGVAYFYLTGGLPGPGQLGGHDPAAVCGAIDWVRTCRIPPG